MCIFWLSRCIVVRDYFALYGCTADHRAAHPISPLDTSHAEIRLLLSETALPSIPVRLSPSHVSLNSWRSEYLSFQDQNASTLSSSQLCKVWKEQHPITLSAPHRELYEAVARFEWGDYICLSYAWGACVEDKATIFVDGIATTVSKRLEGALQDLRSTFECRIGMKVWIDALCIDQTDTVDRGAHVLRVKDIFGRASTVLAWTKDENVSQLCRTSIFSSYVTIRRPSSVDISLTMDGSDLRCGGCYWYPATAVLSAAKNRSIHFPPNLVILIVKLF